VSIAAAVPGEGGAPDGAPHDAARPELADRDQRRIDAVLAEGVAYLRGSEDAPGQAARWLLQHAAGMSSGQLQAQARDTLDRASLRRFRKLLERRAAGEPLAYILGSAAFLDFELEVSPSVLIPRPETEALALWAIRQAERRRQPRVADVGTGSGAIAIAVARAVPGAVVHATDIDARALGVAAGNSLRLGVRDRLLLHETDLLPGAPERFDLIVANLPYVGADELGAVARDVLEHEPHGALFATGDGLTEVRRLLALLADRLVPGGAAGFEIGWRQGRAALHAARAAMPHADVRVEADMAGHDRYLFVVDRLASRVE